jgi:putative PIN family toxin of toxin-antitoxin system
MRIVIDTNVLVSALLSPDSPPAVVLQNLLSTPTASILLSPDLLAEYEEVLSRKKFATVFDATDIRLLLTAIAANSLFIVPSTVVTACEDADDNMVLALALDGFADCIVSGDNDLLKLHPFQQTPILNSADFLAWIASRPS